MSEQVAEVIRVRQLEVVDSEGNTRAEMHVDDKEAVALQMLGVDGKVLSALSVLPDGSTTLNLNSQNRKASVLVTSAPEGLLGLVLLDEEQRQRAAVLYTREHGPAVRVHDEAGKVVWSAVNPQW